MSWMPDLPPTAIGVAENIAYDWTCGLKHEHTVDCLWVWHFCTQVLGSESVAPGEEFGWRPGGVRAHTLVQAHPLTLTASLIWADCCGLHGYITDGEWIQL